MWEQMLLHYFPPSHTTPPYGEVKMAAIEEQFSSWLFAHL